MLNPYEIAHAERYGVPVKRLICDGCGDVVTYAEQTPDEKIVCTGCKDKFYDETKEAIMREFKDNVLFSFVDGDTVDEFLQSQLNRLWEVG